MNVGIDFGTTNSSIAFQRSSREAPECASVDQYSRLPFDVVLRSAVLLDQYGRLIPNGVGAAAMDPVQWLDPKTRAPRRVIERIKPFLSTFRLREQWPVERTRIDLEFYDYLWQEPMVVRFTEIVQSGDMRCSRDELLTAAAAVFRTLFEKTPRSVMQQHPQIVVGVPLIFPDYAKKRLLNIIVRSGIFDGEEPYREALRRVRFLPEPVAASLLYAFDCRPTHGKARGRVLVFDSGGGTLDLALLEFGLVDGEYRPVKQLALGAKAIAGSCYDECIEHFALRQHRDAVRRWAGEKEGADEVTRWHLAQAAEAIKVELSTREEHEELRLIGAGVRPRVTRAQFEQWAQPLLDETEALVRDTVADIDAVDTVVMVGGSSLIPSVQQRLERIFPHAQVIYESAHQTGRGEGMERALTAVSKGLALYDETVTRQGITPFAYGFWDTASGNVIPAASKWSAHTSERPIARIPVPHGDTAVTLTLVQELLQPERVLNILNVPVTGTNAGQTQVSARVRTNDGALYPDIELIDSQTGDVTSALQVATLPDRAIRALVENDDHVIRWPASARASSFDTAFPEVVTLRIGDPVVFVTRSPNGTSKEARGTIAEIHKISDGLRYNEVDHWDLTRWRFYISLNELATATYVPRRISDIRLDRRGSRDRRGHRDHGRV